MPLKLLPIQLSDFSTMITHANLYAPGDDLVGPPTPICWAVSTQAQAHKRLQFHMTAQKSRFLNDTSATYLKVIDEENGEIISIARWHYYPDGFDYTAGMGWECYYPDEKQPFPEEMNVQLHNFILSARDKERENWMVKGKPCYILMHLVTRESQRGRGAAAMLINWGLDKAREQGAPAYLEAGAMARPIYAKYGFQQIGNLMDLDLRPFGVDMDLTLTKMAVVPPESGGDR